MADSPLTPEQRSLRARGAAFAQHAKHDPVKTTEKARKASFDRFLDQVDPNREFDEAERYRRAVAAQKSFMTMLALKSARARRAS